MLPPSAAASTSSWDRRRHWYAPAAHRLLQQHVAAGSSGRFECSLVHAQHAYLWQHTVSGRSILPGAAMFEAAFAGAAALLPEELLQQRQLGLQGAAIAAPLLLKPLPRKGGHALLVLTVQQRSGTVQLSSRDAAAGRRSRPALHLAATAGCIAAATAAAGSPQLLPTTPAAAPLLTVLAQRAPLAPSWLGQALGSICRQPLLPAADSYHCHPAAVDAATHFGATFDLSQSAAPRVPVALDCYSAGSAAAYARSSAAPLCATAAPGKLLQDSSRVSSFGISCSTGGAVLSLGQLQSQPIGSKPVAAAKPSQTAAEALSADCCTYQTVWQAAAPLPAAGSLVARTAQLHLQTGNSSLRVAAAGGMPQMALRSYAAALRLLQASTHRQMQLTATAPAAGSQSGGAVAAPTCCGSLAGTGSAAVSGLLKVAALEEPAWQLRLLLADPAAAGGAALPAADVYGAAAAAGADFRPRMQLAAGQPGAALDAVAAPMHSSSGSGCHVITGGLGGLGMLTACHLAQEGQGGLLLLGRSGRFAESAAAGSQQRQLQQGSCSTTLLQADVAVTADAAAVARQLAHGGAPAASFIHTAGVLADKLLPNQQLADARRVFAPKLSGLAAALPLLLQQPLQQLMLFSSVSAALGNRGQANYAAANAVLDASASALCAAGCGSASMQWGAWAGAGMAVQTLQLIGRLKKQGAAAVSACLMS